MLTLGNNVKCYIYRGLLGHRGLPWWLSGKESACNAGDLGSIPGSGRSPGGGHGKSLQYSCLENPMDMRIRVGGTCSGIFIANRCFVV